jgi:hypothetical protein
VPTRSSFDYAIIRVVPRVERGELINAGVIVYCRALDFLEARIALDRARLLALDPGADVDEVERALELIPLVASGNARAGRLGQMSQAERFHWLVAPRSTVAQTSHVHTGLCADPAVTLDELMQKMVLPPK